MKDYEPNFADRQKQAAEARQAQLKKARLKAAAANDPEAVARQAERRANAEARNLRKAERSALKLREKKEQLEQAAERDARLSPSGRRKPKNMPASKSAQRHCARVSLPSKRNAPSSVRKRPRQSGTAAMPRGRRAKNKRYDPTRPMARPGSSPERCRRSRCYSRSAFCVVSAEPPNAAIRGLSRL